MAVVVQCFHCNAILELDDGFRGGVCRCSTCGSLLQVPKGESDGTVPKKRKARPATPIRPNPSPQPSPSGGASTDTGLSSGQLDPTRRAEIGMSSGLARIHPTRPIAHTSTKRQPTASARQQSISREAGDLQSNRLLFWLGILLAVIITAVGISLLVYYFYYYDPPLPR